MKNGSSSKPLENPHMQKGQTPKPASSSSTIIGPFVPITDHNPRELKSWAKKTGFNSSFSGETLATTSSTSFTEKHDVAVPLDLEKGFHAHERGGSSPKFEIDSILGWAKENKGVEIEPVSRDGRGLRKKRFGVEPVVEPNEEDDLLWSVGNEKEREVPVVNLVGEEPKKNVEKNEMGFDEFAKDQEPEHSRFFDKPVEMRCGLRENPGFASLIYYGLQHYLSISGSLIFIPLVIIPAMGGTDKDTATVISTMLLVSGITTILHSYFGTRLPLVHGSSFVYLAPVLVILNSQEHRNLTKHKFKRIMTELQGAIIVGSVFQSILGYSGLMSLFLRLINPVVVAPTIAAVGLAFFSYGFPQAGTCVETCIPLIMLILIFTLYLRGISIYGHRIFRVYAVPLSVAFVWIYAYFLTTGGAYNYKGCNPDIPISNILSDVCREHLSTMKHCRTDSSNAWRTTDWVRVPYPFQWGIPTFHWRTSIIMVIVSLITSVDSVGIYHSASLLVSSRPPTPGIVSRGIGLEGLCSFLAGLWGTGSGSTTLTENVHTLAITKVANRKSVQLGAIFLILSSFTGKVGALIASIPQALAASVLCFIWALIVALGLSTLQYTETKSFRNIMIIGVSLFLSLSVPSYFQQYQPVSGFVLPSYFVPYAAASSGPFRTGINELDFAVNGLLSLNMVIAFFIAFILDNTVPGSRQERGVYVWSTSEELSNDPSLLADYSLPRKVAKIFRWAKCVGM